MEASENNEFSFSERAIKSLTWGVVSNDYDDDTHIIEESNGILNDVSSVSSLTSNDLNGGSDGLGPSPGSDEARRNRILR